MRLERIALALLLYAAVFTAAARDLPSVVQADAPGLDLHGSAEMRRFGFKIYTARLWTGAEGYHPGRPFALDLEYAVNLKGDRLADVSVDQMRGLGLRNDALLERWRVAMAEAFPDVKKGDRLVGLALPGREARFYSNDRLLATIRDPAFVDAFFSIWLDRGTSAPEVRAGLLGTTQRQP